jgi:phosphoribosylamine--glycine ligase
MMKKNILLLGSGGREHAFAWKLAKSNLLGKLYIAPGNAGTIGLGENVSLGINDFPAIAEFCLDNNIHWLIPGSEDPLVNGIWDYFNEREDLSTISVIGPSKEGATLEGSKDYAKEFMVDNNIPTAAYKSFTKDTVDQGKEFLNSLKAPYVLKADGLAAGKGVLICESYEEACNNLEDMLLDAKFGDSSSRVVIEEFLHGIELSVFVLTDGESYVTLPEAKDYKRIGEGDTGLNTGGMGSISPVGFAQGDFLQKVDERIVKPTIEGLKAKNIPYSGFVFIGLMNVGGEPYVIEYNVRMGDPETQSVFPRIKNDFVELFGAVADKNLNSVELEIDERSCASVILVSGGYPESYSKGEKISGLDTFSDSIVFHAGTKMDEGNLVTSGGRVFAITSLGGDLPSALGTSMKNAEKVSFNKMYYRRDIGKDLLESSSK